MTADEDLPEDEALDASLRGALRPVDPGEQFTARVLAARRAGAAPRTTREAPRRWRVPAALAASLALAAVAGLFVVQQRAQEEAERQRVAHAQVIQALQIASAQLDAVHRRLESHVYDQSM
jgi:anti-sigma factor RsiW